MKTLRLFESTRGSCHIGLAFGLILMFSLPLVSDATLPRRSTLVVALPSAKGLVICADKRSHDALRGVQDNDTKITPIGKRALFVSTGAPILLRKSDLSVTFSADAVVKRFFERHNFIVSDDQWPDLARSLAGAFDAYLASKKFEDWPPAASDPLFQVPIFYLDAENRIRLVVFKLSYMRIPPPDTTVRLEQYPENHFKALNPFAFGDVAVLDELTSGADPRFDHIRRDPAFRRYIRSSVPVSHVSVRHAVEFASGQIRLTNELTPLIPGATGHVSRNCDCAILAHRTGFRWIWRDR